MNEKLYVALGSVLILLFGFSPIVNADTKDDHAGGTPAAPASAGRETVKAQLPDQYTSLIDFLKPEKVKLDGVKAHVLLLGKDKVEERKIGLKELDGMDVEGLRKWVNTFAEYRKGLAGCEVNMSDTSAKLLGATLDKLMSELNHLTAAKAPEWKISERKILAYILEVERFLKAKADKAWADGNKDFTKADEALAKQLEKTAAALFGEYRGAKFDMAAEIKKDEEALAKAEVDRTAKPSDDAVTKAVDSISTLIQGGGPVGHVHGPQAAPTVAPTADVKEIHDEVEKAVTALKERTGKACSITLESAASTTATTDKKEDKKEEKKHTPSTPSTVSETTKPKTDLVPGPLPGNGNGGGTPDPNPPTPNPNPNPNPPTPNPNPNPVTPTDPGTFNANPGAAFDPNGLLAQLQQQSDLARQQAEQQLRQFGDLFNLLGQQNADAQRAALQALADQNRNNDDTSALLAKALGERQEPVVIPPQNQFPPITPPQIANSEPPQQPQVPFQDQQQPPPPPVNPLLGGFPQSPSPTPYYPPERNRFDDYNSQPNPALLASLAAIPRQDPFQLMMQQFMMQQWLQQQQGMNPRANAFGMAGRVPTMGPRPMIGRPGAPFATSRIPGRGPMLPARLMGR